MKGSVGGYSMDRVVMRQNWRDLLFLSWEVEPHLIQSKLPKGLWVDTFNGKAFVSLVPFVMQDVCFSGFFQMPSLNRFYEVNLRTYVKDERGVRAVWFFSLDFNSWLGSYVARTFFHLPYRYAAITYQNKDGILFNGKRKGVEYSIHYRPDSIVFKAEPESLDAFIAERYSLFTAKDGKIQERKVRHIPYPLSKVQYDVSVKELFLVNGFDFPKNAPCHAVYSKGVDVQILT